MIKPHIKILLLGAMLLLAGFTSSSLAEGRNAISALGFLEPEGGIVSLSGSTSSQGAVISELRVGEGDKVTAGQIVAILDSNPILQATLKQAEANIEVFKARLELVKAGVSKGKIKAQRAKIKRLEVEIKTATAKCKRAKKLRAKGTLSQASIEDRCLNESLLTVQLQEGRASLSAISEVRSVDVAVASAELVNAEAALLKAQAEFERSMVRAPFGAQVLKLHARVGELVGAKGLLQLARTDRMWVRAEVYETEIGRVRPGQRVTVSSDGFSGKLQGTVEDIGLIIGSNRVKGLDPTSQSNARVAEVKIKLDEADSQRVSRLVLLQVTVVIDIGAVGER